MTTFTVLIYILHANVFAQITPGTLDTPVFTQIAPAPPGQPTFQLFMRYHYVYLRTMNSCN